MKQDWRERDFLSPKQIGEILGIHSNTVYSLVNRLPHVKLGRSYRIPTEAFMKWIKDEERRNAT